MSLFSKVALGFWGRRALDWGGWMGSVIIGGITLYNSLPPATQATIGSVLKGDWQSITLGALVPLLVWGWSQVMSFKATVKPQIVTREGEKVELEKLPPAAQEDVTIRAKAAKRSMTVLDMLAEKLNRR